MREPKIFSDAYFVNWIKVLASFTTQFQSIEWPVSRSNGERAWRKMLWVRLGVWAIHQRILKIGKKLKTVFTQGKLREEERTVVRPPISYWFSSGHLSDKKFLLTPKRERQLDPCRNTCSRRVFLRKWLSRCAWLLRGIFRKDPYFLRWW